jgi:hypothetical protein
MELLKSRTREETFCRGQQIATAHKVDIAQWVKRVPEVIGTQGHGDPGLY